MERSIQVFSLELTKRIMPEIEYMVETFRIDPEEAFYVYLDFIRSLIPSIKKIISQGLKDSIEVGYISSRLLRDPIETGIRIKEDGGSLDEMESHIVGYLKAILSLTYCVFRGLEGWQFKGSVLHRKIKETQNVWSIDVLPSILHIVRNEMKEIEFEEGKMDDREGKMSNTQDKLGIEYNEGPKYDYPKSEPTTGENGVPFTARLLAYYRVQELKRESPLVVDHFAEDLAGNLSSYAQKHEFIVKKGDYPIIRSHYIDSNLLKAWCDQKNSQIVLLGAGLDTRAYRFIPVKQNEHIIFEIDFKNINQYKELILSVKKPLCTLKRVNADLSQSDWKDRLEKSGFTSELPTFWILEGLAYYIEQRKVISLLTTMAEISHKKSKLFIDVCVPALADLVFGPFTRHFKWGINKAEIPRFFATTGWHVSCSYADDHDLGRDVGQRGLIFVNGRIL